MPEHEKPISTKYLPEWLISNPNLVDMSKRLPEITEWGKGKIEYAHLMLKPEAIMAIQRGHTPYIQQQIMELAESSGMLTSRWQYLTLKPEEVNQIYHKQIANGWITTERIESLSHWPTAHLFLTGNHSRIVSAIIRGRVSCKGGEYCFTRFLPEDNSVIVPDIIKNCPPETLPEKAWGMGCGARLELINSGILVPQERQRGNDTTWNMVHGSDSSDDYVTELVVLVNSLSNDRYYQSLGDLPQVPEFRTK